MQDLKNNLKDR